MDMKFDSYPEAKAAYRALGEAHDYEHFGGFLRDCEIPRDECGFLVGHPSSPLSPYDLPTYSPVR